VSTAGWTWAFVAATLALYLSVTAWARARSTADFYVARRSIPPALNGMATGADWVSAASFVSMAGVIAFTGRDGGVYLVGWTGGYVLLAVLLAPHLRRYGRYTVPQLVGERYGSGAARLVAVVCAVAISFTYLVGQLRGVGVVVSRALGVTAEAGAWAGAAVVLVATVLGGMRGVTYTQVAHYVVVVTAYLVPAILVSILLTGQAVPALGLGGRLSADGARLLGADEGRALLAALDDATAELGFGRYTAGARPALDLVLVATALMAGTAALPSAVVRFFTVPRIRDARATAAWSLAFIAVLYLTVPAVAAFSRATLIASLSGRAGADAPAWFATWERAGLAGWTDRNGDGRMQWSGDPARNEVRVDPDAVVLAAPEVAGLPAWVPALAVAGALAAALSTSAGLLLVIAAAVAHDVVKAAVAPRLSRRRELWWARGAAAAGAVAAAATSALAPAPAVHTVALAFGLAAASLFPALALGVFWRRATREGAIAGMVAGAALAGGYAGWCALHGGAPAAAGVSAQGIGAVGMLLNFAVAIAVSLATPAPPAEVQARVERLRFPRDGGPDARAAAPDRGAAAR
jgi:cation/acetate symporter